jgi:co-chaperonin GroES (HSP10)
MKKFKREIQPAGFRILIKPDWTEEVTSSGIIIQREEIAERSETKTGTIIAVGPTAWQQYDDGQPWAKVGDRVYYNPYACKFIETGEDKPLVMVNDGDIQAIIVKEEEVNG